MSYTYATDHTSPLFWNENTNAYVPYKSGFQALDPLVGWPNDWRDAGVSEHLDTNPNLAGVHRVYMVDTTGRDAKLHEVKSQDAAPSYNSLTNRWELDYSIRAKVGQEIIDMNNYVQMIAENRRITKLYEDAPVVEYNGVKAEAGSGAVITEKINQLSSQDEITTINWEGPNDPLTGISEWFDATLADFQGLAVVPLPHSEKGFAAKRTVMAAHLVTPFDTEQDVIDAFDVAYGE